MSPGRVAATLSVLILCGCATIMEGMKDTKEIDIVGLQDMHRSAQEAYSKGELDRAAEIYQKIISISQADAETWFIIGNIYAGKGDNETALSSYRRSLSINGADARAWNNLSFILLKDAWNAAQQARQNSVGEDPAHLSSKRIIDALSKLNFPSSDKGKTPAANLDAVTGKAVVPKTQEKIKPEALPLPIPAPAISTNPLPSTEPTGAAAVAKAAPPLTLAAGPTASPPRAAPVGSTAPVVITNLAAKPAPPKDIKTAAEIEKDTAKIPPKPGLRVETIKGAKPGTTADSVYVKATERLTIVIRDLASGIEEYLTLLKDATLRVPIKPGEIYQFRSASSPVLVYQDSAVPDSLSLKTWLRFVPAPQS